MSTSTSGAVGTDFTHFIGGESREPEGDATVEVITPATEEVIAVVPQATVAEAERAILAARRAFDEGPWPRMTRAERSRILKDFADALLRHRDKLVDIAVAQGGCTITQARGMQVYMPIMMMQGYAELAETYPVET